MKTAVLLCGQRTPAAPPIPGGHEVVVVEELCQRPGQIAALAGAADRLVLGVCLPDVSVGAVQAEARHAGIDPLGMEVLDLESFTGADDELGLVLAARIARATAFTGSRPEQAKLEIPPKLSRRDLLRRQVHHYIAAPAIDPAACAAESGCRACVDVCPRSALTWSEGAVSYDRVACEACGQCVTTCPTGATVNPATTPAQLQAEVSALLDPSVGPAGPRGIVFTCSRGHGLPGAEERGWYPVMVPCTGMVTPTWLLAPLLMGAGKVVAAPCTDTGCPLGHDQVATAAVDFCRGLLTAVGEPAERVSLVRGDLIDPLTRADLDEPFGPGAAVHVVRALGSLGPSPSTVAIDHESSPLGLVEIDPDACTACTLCARACPTDALDFTETLDDVSISFDASACVACAQCTARCPEIGRGAIAMHTRTSYAALDRGRVELMTAPILRCESCAAPIAAAPALERIATILARENAAVTDLLQRRCVDCRGRVPIA